jgi:hypothetical protein
MRTSDAPSNVRACVKDRLANTEDIKAVTEPDLDSKVRSQISLEDL